MPETLPLPRQLRSFIAIGLACTAATALIYTALRGLGVEALPANAIALTATMAANFTANRRITFGATGGPLLRQLGGYLVSYGLGLAAASAVLTGLLAALGDPSGALDTGAAVVSGIAATAVRFLLMRGWVFAPAPPAPATDPVPA